MEEVDHDKHHTPYKNHERPEDEPSRVLCCACLARELRALVDAAGDEQDAEQIDQQRTEHVGHAPHHHAETQAAYAADEPQGAVAYLIINRPEALNALNSQVLADLDAALDAIDLDAVRCLIVRGAGEKSFVAGADIAQMKGLTKAEGESFGKQGNDVMRKLETLPIPTIAAVGGYALGGGCELAMSCDFRICSDTAVFGQPETGLGITPGFGGTQRLARLIGPGMAKQMVYTARNIKADEALRIGLVNAVYPLAELYAAAEKLASQIAANAPIAVRAAKKAINEGLDLPMDEAVVVEEKAFGSCFETADQQEGMGAFLEKRKHEPFTNK